MTAGASVRGARVLVTGGTGSFGEVLVGDLLRRCEPELVVVLSRDEFKQSELRHRLGADPRLRLELGDVRDRGRVEKVVRGVDVVVHAAALKQVDTAERHPFECVRTNVIGTQNLVEACLAAGVGRTISLSTDKASSPVNVYGATKFTADALVLAADAESARDGGEHRSRFAVVRHGNLLGSRGSVVPTFRRIAAAGGPLPITDPAMTRFVITALDAARFLLRRLDDMAGGELFVARSPSARLVDLAAAVAPDVGTVVVGRRPGERLHEELVAADAGAPVVRRADHLVVGGPAREGDAVLPAGFRHTSDAADDRLDVDGLRAMIARADREAAGD